MSAAKKKPKVARTVAEKERDAYANELLKCQEMLVRERTGYLAQLDKERGEVMRLKIEIRSWRDKHAAMMKRPDVSDLVCRIDEIAAPPDAPGSVHQIRSTLQEIVGGLLIRGDEYRLALAPFARRCARYEVGQATSGRYPDDTPLELEGNADPHALRVGDLRAAKALYDAPTTAFIPERDLA